MHIRILCNFLFLSALNLLQVLALPHVDRHILVLRDAELSDVYSDILMLEHRAPVKAKPKPGPAQNPKPTPKQTPGKPTPGKATPKPTPTPVENLVWETLNVQYETKAFDTCDTFVDCGEAGEQVDARGPKRRGALVFEITLAPSPTHSAQPQSQIEKRDQRTYTPKAVDGTFSIISLDYPSGPELYIQEPGQPAPVPHVLDFASDDDGDFKVTHSRTLPRDPDEFVTEHIVELQSVMKFIDSAVTARPTLKSFFKNYWNKKLGRQDIDDRKYQPDIDMGEQDTLNDLVFESLGSDINRDDLVLCRKTINGYKAALWSEKSPMEDRIYRAAVKSSFDGGLPSSVYLSALRTTLAVFEYMNNKEVSDRLKSSVTNVGTELKNVKELTGQNVELSVAWRKFMIDHLAAVGEHGKAWLIDRITKDTEDQIDAEIVKMERKEKELLAKEKGQTSKSAYYQQQVKKDNALKATAKRQRAAVEKHKQKIIASGKARSAVTTKIVKQRRKSQKVLPGNDRRLAALIVERKLKEDIHKKNKKQLPNIMKAAGKTERKRMLLKASRVKEVIAGLREDKKKVVAFKRATSRIKMPKIA